jgi:hypothetical protein
VIVTRQTITNDLQALSAAEVTMEAGEADRGFISMLLMLNM